MDLAAKHRMTVPEYLDWALAQPKARLELVRSEVVAMAPERAIHNLTKGEAVFALHNAIKRAGLPYTVYIEGLAVTIDNYTAREPDAAVHSDPAFQSRVRHDSQAHRVFLSCLGAALFSP